MAAKPLSSSWASPAKKGSSVRRSILAASCICAIRVTLFGFVGFHNTATREALLQKLQPLAVDLGAHGG